MSANPHPDTPTVPELSREAIAEAVYGADPVGSPPLSLLEASKHGGWEDEVLSAYEVADALLPLIAAELARKDEEIERLDEARQSAIRQLWELSERAETSDARRVELEQGAVHPALSIDVQEHRQQAYQGGWGDGYAEGYGKAQAALTAERKAREDAERERDMAASLVEEYSKHAQTLAAQVAALREPWLAADERDWTYLLSLIGHGGRDRFWTAILAEHRAALSASETGDE